MGACRACPPSLSRKLTAIRYRNQKEKELLTSSLKAAVVHAEIREVLLQAEVGNAEIEALSGVADNPKVQSRLFELLAQGSYAAEEALRKAASNRSVWERLLQLADDPNTSTRRLSVLALSGAASEPRVQERLLELTEDVDQDVSSEAVRALAEAARERRVQERLLDLTRRDYDNVDSLALRAIIALGRVASVPSVLDRLLELSQDKYETIAWEATKSLAAVATDPRVKDHLLRLDHSPVVIGAALRVLGNIAFDPQVRERLLEMSGWQEKIDPDDQIFVRRPAVEGLMRLAPDATICSRMLDLILDPQPVLRGAASQWLSWAAPTEPSVQQYLLELTRINLSYARGAAARALAAIASDLPVRTRLLELTYDPDPSVCLDAARSLKKAASDTAVRKRLLALTHGLRYPSYYPAVRIAAAWALGGVPKEAITRKVLKRVARIARRDDSVLDALETLVQGYEEARINPAA
jgi:HEAT repeat protein